ncbi:MAG: hypothetical protein QM765_45315 [Myxococcales bacterium]
MIAALLLAALASAPASASASEAESAPALARASAPAAESPHRFDLDASFAYGFGSGQGFGGFLEGRYGFKLWETSLASGELQAGVLLGYQAEPHSVFGSYFGEAKLTGENHRLETWLVLGHGFRLPPSRRVLWSFQVFGGWTHYFVRGGLQNDSLGVSGQANADAGAFTTGLMTSVGISVSERVALTLRFVAPLPYAMSVNSWFMGSLGLSVRLQ